MLLFLGLLHPSEQPNVINTSKLPRAERSLQFPSDDHEESDSQHRILGLIRKKRAGWFIPWRGNTHTNTVTKMEMSFLVHLWNSFWINELDWGNMTNWTMLSACCWIIGKVMNFKGVKNSKGHSIINGQYIILLFFPLWWMLGIKLFKDYHGNIVIFF